MGTLLVFMLVTGLAAVSAAKDLLNAQPNNGCQLATILEAFGRVYFGAGLVGLIIAGAAQLYVIVSML